VVASPALEDDMNRLVSMIALTLSPLLAAAELDVVIVEGLGGEERYADQFAEQVAAIEQASLSMTKAERVKTFRSGEFSREEVLAHFESIDDRLGANDRLAVFLIGHGSYDDHEYKFNIGGPDLTDADLFNLLENTAAGNVLLVNTSSSSGATADRLKADGRTLILATRSGAERHAARFGSYFFAALRESTADVDKNRVISAEEAFRFAERQVSDYYERNGQLATEHPRLEGSQAARFSLARLDDARPVQGDAALQQLLGRRDELNGDLEGLRLRRETMSADDYQSELLERMIELATLEEQIEARERELADGN
jgi:hypothetical protein